MTGFRLPPLPADMQQALDTATLTKKDRVSIGSALRQLARAAVAHGLVPAVNEACLSALHESYIREGRPRTSLNSALFGIRKFAKATGLTLEWRPPEVHRIGLSRSDLPKNMRRALEDMETGRQRALGKLRPARVRQIETVLRDLTETIRDANAGRADGDDSLPEALTEQTAALYQVALGARGVRPSVIENYKTQLRTYAKYAKEGLDWAHQSRGIDTRAIHEVLEGRHWRPFRAQALELIEDGARYADIKLVDAFLKLPRRSGIVNDRDVEIFLAGSPSRAIKLLNIFRKLAPRSPDLIPLRAANTRLRPPPRETASGVGKRGRSRTVAVDPEDLPEDIKENLARMATSVSSATRDNMEDALTQLVFSARKQGLAETISEEVLCAWIDDLEARNCANTSMQSHMNAALLYARKADVDEAYLDMLSGDRSIYGERAQSDDRRRSKRLDDHPVSIHDVVQAASAWSRKAEALSGEIADNAWRRMWVGVPLLAFLTFRQLRAADLLDLTVGVSAIRYHHRWRISLIQSKTKKKFDQLLNERLTGYIDLAILQGVECDSERQFWELYNRRIGTNLFAKPDGSAFSHTWLYNVCNEAFGHGPHATRSMIYDHLAEYGERGRRAGQSKTGHKSPESIKQYKESADAIQMDKADELLADGQDNIEGAD